MSKERSTIKLRKAAQKSKMSESDLPSSQTPTPILKSSVGVNVKRSTRSSNRIAYSQLHASQSRGGIKKSYRDAGRARLGDSQKTDTMQASMRPRQRTFTSCTECRRRKQRCNQAKDRPCNNCARRYPPVVCTYESSSPPPTIDRIVDFHDDHHHGSSRSALPSPSPGSSYVQTYPASMTYTATPTTTDGYYNSSASYGYYSAPVSTSRNDYHSYSAGGSSPGYTVPAYTSASYAPVSAGYYQSVPSTSYTPVTTGGYYSNSQQDGAWLSTADPAAFAGAGSADYYYVADPDPDPGHHGHQTSGP